MAKKRTKKARSFNLQRYIISVLRRASYRLRYRTEALNEAKVHYGKYKCALCEEIFSRSDIHVDHIYPIVPITGWDGWDGYIERLFCDAKDLQILCKPCHNIKSQKENKERRENDKKNK